MTTHRTSDLSGALLDAAVAKAEGYDFWIAEYLVRTGDDAFSKMNGGHRCVVDGLPFEPSTDWRTGGAFIQRDRISVSNPNGDPGWVGCISYPTKPKRNGTPQWGHHWICGPTPLIAAMRAFVLSRLGETVELP